MKNINGLIFQCANRIGTTAMAAAGDSVHLELTRSEVTLIPMFSAPHAITRVYLAKDLATPTASPVTRIRSSYGTTEGHCAY